MSASVCGRDPGQGAADDSALVSSCAVRRGVVWRRPDSRPRRSGEKRSAADGRPADLAPCSTSTASPATTSD